MITADLPDPLPIWHLITRMGEAEILLPVAVLSALALCLRPDKRRLALAWMLLIITAALITTASKVAFIGWGIGWAAINFTGVSGHAMFATAIYPLLMLTLVGGEARARQRFALALGFALAVLVGVSRVEVGAHAWSEVLAGWLLGGAATLMVLAVAGSGGIVLRPIVPIIFLAWMSITPGHMQASQTHSLVTRLALKLSGHVQPYTRSDLLRSLRAQNA